MLKIKDILDEGILLFDFDYTLNPLKTKEDIEQQFVDRYFYKEVEYDDIDEFKHELKVLWRESLTNYNKELTANANELGIFRNQKGDIVSKNVFNDMPDSKLDIDDYASAITDINNASSGYTNITEAELLKKYYDNLVDIDSKFLDIFNTLFVGVYGYSDNVKTELREEIKTLELTIESLNTTITNLNATIVTLNATIASQQAYLDICDDANDVLVDIIGGVV